MAYLPTGHSISFDCPTAPTNQPGFANVQISVAPVASEKDPAEQAKHALAPAPGEPSGCALDLFRSVTILDVVARLGERAARRGRVCCV